MQRVASTTLVLIGGLGAASYAQTPLCSCPNSTALYENYGGEGSPLTWLFQAYEKISATVDRKQVICYRKHVENRSALDVTDVYWPVAGFKREVIPPMTARPVCVDYAGGMKMDIDRGPLHHGIGSAQYPTTVKPPESGWYAKTAQTVLNDLPPLRSDLLLDTRSKEGRLQTSHVIIESSVSYEGGMGIYHFNIVNEGSGALGFFLNIRILPEMYKYIPAAEKIYFLKANDKVSFTAPAAEKPEFAPATVTFYGENGREAAQETIGFYVPENGKSIRLEEGLWGNPSPRQPPTTGGGTPLR